MKRGVKRTISHLPAKGAILALAVLALVWGKAPSIAQEIKGDGAGALAGAETHRPGLDRDGIAKAFGKKGETIDGTYKVSFPRSDLHVKVGKIPIKPGFALTNWAGFIKSGDSAITYGDLVLLESETNPVISKLMEYGIQTVALHNHLIYETPRIFYVHFMGHGNEVDMARGLKEALVITGTPLKSSPASTETKPDMAKQIEEVLGYQGTMKDGVLHVNVPRKDVHVNRKGAEIPGNMGMNIPLNFQIAGDKAAINGDFMLLAGEVSPVIKVLRENRIEVASLHNHMLDEEPRLFFMHFWAYGDASTLAKGLKAALDQTGVKK
ncbi:MAG: DUF1259 domain-containing protein [Candidatus Methylomirabilis oxyfera]|nr:DUF1259 domain-containing protein [Candidatus Methylomirabilis oxyfera]